MVRIAKKTDAARLKELKRKINDEKYLQAAVNKIAQTLSSGIFNLQDETASFGRMQ